MQAPGVTTPAAAATRTSAANLWFSNGSSDDVVVHVLPDSFLFKSSEA
jgi:hypothetical protein